MGYGPWGRKESDKTERLSISQHQGPFSMENDNGIVIGIQSVQSLSRGTYSNSCLSCL